MRFIATQQDYGWFVVALVWACAILLWWRHARNDRTWDWVAWSGLASTATAIVETCTQVSSPWKDQLVGLHPVADTALGIMAALQVAGWGIVAFERRGPAIWRIALTTASITALLYGASKWWMPEWALWLLPACVMVIGWRLRWRLRGSAWGRLAVIASATTVVFGSWGPVSTAFHMGRRWTELNPFGVVSLGVHALAGVFVCLALWPPPKGAIAHQRADLIELRWFLGLAAGWLAAGLALAGWSTRIAHRTFAQSLTAQATIASQSIDLPVLRNCLGPAFKIDEVRTSLLPTGKKIEFGVSHALAAADRTTIERQLDSILKAVPTIRSLFIVTIRDGRVLGCIFPGSNFAPGGDISIERRVTADDQLAWARQEERFWGLISTPYGDVVAVWTPLVAEREMLGWLALEYSANEWLANQAQGRWQMFAITGLGALAGLFAFLQRRQERAALRTRQEAQLTAAISTQKSAFLAKVSHELRTPIQTILGYGEWLERSSENPESRERARALRQHTALMLRLVNDLLDLGAIEAGSFRLSAKPFSPAELVRHALASFRPAAEAKSLRLELHLDPGVPAFVRGDPDRFNQVVLNLVGNAVKFTPAGSVRVTLRAADHEPGNALCLEVADTGPGIPADQLRTLFEPFARLERTSPQQGAGLGLSLAAALCRNMSGQLLVRSEEGQGSVFTATMRLPQDHAPQRATSPRIDLQGCTILIAEDNALIRDLFSAFFTDSGATCVSAADGIEALREADRRVFDAVFVDLSMPRLDGMEVARALRRKPPPTRPGRIIGVSAHASAAEREAALAAGMDEFLSKPTPLSELARAALGGRAGVAGRPIEQARSSIVERLRGQFRLEIGGQSAALAAAIGAENWLSVRSQAHYLANSAVAIQDMDLHEIFSALERAAANHDRATVRYLSDQLQPALEPWRSDTSFSPATSESSQNQT